MLVGLDVQKGKRMEDAPKTIGAYHYLILAFTMLFPLMLQFGWLLGILVLPALLFDLRKYRKRWFDHALLWGALGMVILRGLAFLYAVTGFSAVPPRYTSLPDFKEKDPIVYLLSFQEAGSYEMQIYSHSRRLAELQESPSEAIDPFSGEPFKYEEGTYYSIGPDQIDQRGEIAYDPTNGIFSVGDIVVK